MNKRIIPALMSGLLILGSCFSTVSAGQENKKTNWRRIAYQMAETPAAVAWYGAFGLGTAFIPTGTLVFSIATLFGSLGQEQIKMHADTDLEKLLLEIRATLIFGAGMAGHTFGCYLFLKGIKQALESL